MVRFNFSQPKSFRKVLHHCITCENNTWWKVIILRSGIYSATTMPSGALNKVFAEMNEEKRIDWQQKKSAWISIGNLNNHKSQYDAHHKLSFADTRHHLRPSALSYSWECTCHVRRRCPGWMRVCEVHYYVHWCPVQFLTQFYCIFSCGFRWKHVHFVSQHTANFLLLQMCVLCSKVYWIIHRLIHVLIKLLCNRSNFFQLCFREDIHFGQSQFTLKNSGVIFKTSWDALKSLFQSFFYNFVKQIHMFFCSKDTLRWRQHLKSPNGLIWTNISCLGFTWVWISKNDQGKKNSIVWRERGLKNTILPDSDSRTVPLGTVWTFKRDLHHSLKSLLQLICCRDFLHTVSNYIFGIRQSGIRVLFTKEESAFGNGPTSLMDWHNWGNWVVYKILKHCDKNWKFWRKVGIRKISVLLVSPVMHIYV